MSTSKLDTSGVFQPVTVKSDRTTLNLPQAAVRIRKNGIEFRSPTPIPVWTEMTVSLQSAGETKKGNCTGIVVARQGNRHPRAPGAQVLMRAPRHAEGRVDLVAHCALAGLAR